MVNGSLGPFCAYFPMTATTSHTSLTLCLNIAEPKRLLTYTAKSYRRILAVGGPVPARAPPVAFSSFFRFLPVVAR